MGIEGCLNIRLDPARGSVAIRSTRPLAVSRAFEGRDIDDVLKHLPLLFNVCARAQATAGIRAVESALGRPASSRVECAREDLLALEILQEHLWRVLLEWPVFYGGAPQSAVLAECLKEIQALHRFLDPTHALLTRPGLQQHHTPSLDQRRAGPLQQGLAECLFACELGEWSAFNVGALNAWIDTAETPATRLLRWVQDQGWAELGRTRLGALSELADDELMSRLDADDAQRFIQTPDWRGRALETGPAARLRRHPLLRALARDHGRGLLWRLVARLLEIALLAERLSAGALIRPRTGHAGLCQLEAARGRLCHRVTLKGRRITRYRILAPTEWNFHPEGAAAQALATIRPDHPQGAETQARLLIHALDPCVGFALSLEHADA